MAAGNGQHGAGVADAGERHFTRSTFARVL